MSDTLRKWITNNSFQNKETINWENFGQANKMLLMSITIINIIKPFPYFHKNLGKAIFTKQQIKSCMCEQNH